MGELISAGMVILKYVAGFFLVLFLIGITFAVFTKMVILIVKLISPVIKTVMYPINFLIDRAEAFLDKYPKVKKILFTRWQ